VYTPRRLQRWVLRCIRQPKGEPQGAFPRAGLSNSVAPAYPAYCERAMQLENVGVYLVLKVMNRVLIL